MSLLSPQVAAFIAVVEERSFEAAAIKLSVTSSAISQRIKQLEDRMGQLLVVRQSPCIPTPAGEQLLKRVKPMSLLEAEVMAEFLPDQQQANQNKTLAIAVNEDSLTTWLLAAISELNEQHGYLFDIRVDDQEYTLDHLKQGSVIGALTSEKTALQGCVCHALGCMRYRAIASPAIYQAYFAQGATAEAFKQAPMINYNRKDPLQMRFIQHVTKQRVTPDRMHYLPNSIALVDAVKQNMGWCMAAEGLIGDLIDKGELVDIAPTFTLDDPLYWQHAGVRSDVLSKITKVFYSASASLYRGG